jgi:amino-acid N-acetyltransferase
LIDDVCKNYFHVTERDGKVIACCALKPCGNAPDAHEVAAFAVSPEYRRGGRGDALLEYAENYACETLATSRLFLLTTRTADWFVQRGFENKGLAENNPELPPGKSVQSGRGSVLFVKYLDR